MGVQIRVRQSGDLAWAVQRHATLYATEFGYAPLFEDYVLRSVSPFLEQFDAARDGFWVADQGGHRVGCIAIQHDVERPGWAQLRWYLVEPGARGQGVGKALLDQAIGFSRKAGYQGIWLRTVDDLHAARRHYERAGFQLVHTDAVPCPWAPWGHEQRWELAFAG